MLPLGKLFIWKSLCNTDMVPHLGKARSYHDSAICMQLWIWDVMYSKNSTVHHPTCSDQLDKAMYMSSDSSSLFYDHQHERRERGREPSRQPSKPTKKDTILNLQATISPTSSTLDNTPCAPKPPLYKHCNNWC